jgi:hypothetical protein
MDEDNQPVAGAVIWVNDGEYKSHGTTNGKGLFALELDGPSARARWRTGAMIHVGARHEFHAPSTRATWSGPSQERLVFRLRGRGAVLVVQVVDDSGLAVPGAELRVTPAVTRDATGFAKAEGKGPVTRAPAVLTNGWGEAVLRGLEPGQARVQLSAQGFCPRSTTLRLVAGESTQRRLRMQHASSIEGRLTRTDGHDVSCARITGMGDDPDSVVETGSNARGEFFLRNLPAGRISLHAVCRDNGQITHQSTAEMVLEPGELGIWNALLEPVEVLAGTLLNAEGLPLVGWRVELQLEDAAQEPLHVTRTDEDGRYVLPDSQAGRAAQLYLYHPLAAGSLPTRVLQDPRSREDEIRLNQDEEHATPLRGRLREASGRPAVGVTFLVHLLGTGHNLSLTTDLVDASFRTPPLPPGEYVLIFPNHGRGWIPDVRYRVGAGELLDIGSLSLPAFGWLALAPSVPSRNSECRELRLVLQRPNIAPDFAYIVHDGRVELPIEVTLASGQYTLTVQDDPGQDSIEFTVASGATTQLGLPCTD